MDTIERARLLAEIEQQLCNIKRELTGLYEAMAQIGLYFRLERGERMRRAHRETRFSQTTALWLDVSRTQTVLRVPHANWRCSNLKGRRVDEILEKRAGDNRVALAALREKKAKRPQKQMPVLGNTIPKSRADGWRIRNLTRYANPVEFDLVEEVELKMRPLRRRVAMLADAGKRLLQSRYQHERNLEKDANGVSTLKRSAPADVPPQPIINAPSEGPPEMAPDAPPSPRQFRIRD